MHCGLIRIRAQAGEPYTRNSNTVKFNNKKKLTDAVAKMNGAVAPTYLVGSEEQTPFRGRKNPG